MTYVANFRNQVKKLFVPLASKMHEERRKYLGLEKLDYVDEGIYFLEWFKWNNIFNRR